MHSAYAYRPLAKARAEIRLLTLDHLPTALREVHAEPQTRRQISGSLSHVSLDERPSYKALSYAWGALASPRYPILVDGDTVMVTQNLHEALELIQTLPRMPALWIDAVCINQADDEEKRTQVPLMHRIYGEAEEVLIWLGPAADQSTEAIRLLVGWAYRFAAFLEEHGVEGVYPDTPLRKLMLQITDGFPVALWIRPVTRLFARPWWRRVWVMQEVILAKSAIIYCGDVAVAWNDIEWVIEMFSYPDACNGLDVVALALPICQRAHLRRLRLDYLGRYRDWVPGLTWEELLSITCEWPFMPEATDERDRIYGLMGLLLEEDRVNVPVDYSSESTVARIAFDVSCIVIGRTGPRCMIYCNDARPRPSGLPTWAPNWYSCQSGNFRAWNDVYDAAKGTTWTPRLLSMSFANPKLKLRGVLVGHIRKTLTKDARSSSDSKPTLQSFRSWESDLASTLRETADRGGTGTAASFCDRLWWLAVMGIPSSGRWPVTDFERKQLLAAYEVFVGIRQPPDSLDIDKRHDWYEKESALYRKALKFDKYRLFVTSNGYPGLGQASVQVDDRVVIFQGCSVPFTIRQQEDGDYHLTGPSYVLGVMDGEAMENGPDFQEIVLV
ncbi:hypothetical protein B7463_g9013, partial [Scytalidium lignicola]